MASLTEFIIVFPLGIICSLILLFTMSRIFQNIRNPSHRCSLVVCTSLLVMFAILSVLFPNVSRNEVEWRKDEGLVPKLLSESPQYDKEAMIGRLREELQKSVINYPIAQIDLESAAEAFEEGTLYIQRSPRKVVNCVKRPRLNDIRISNKYWQVLKTNGSNPITYYLYGAYLDTRLSEKKGHVRILMLADRNLIIKRADEIMHEPKFCQFFYANESRVEVNKTVSMMTPWYWNIHKVGNHYHPYLITCQLPTQPDYLPGQKYLDIPVSVSLVMKKCDLATNNVEIIYNVPEEMKDFGICFKVLDFPKVSVFRRVIEMVEFLKILGVGGVHFPYMEGGVDNETMKVLKYYESTGYATLKGYSLPNDQMNFPLSRHVYLKNNIQQKRKQELIPYNDCFLSNLYRYKIIGILDIDEVLVPTRDFIYQDVLRKIWKPTYASYCFSMKMFLESVVYNQNEKVELDLNQPSDPLVPEITKHVFFDRGPVCSQNRTRSIKCFHRTDSVLLVHNHYPLYCLENKFCQKYKVPESQAYIHHHRGMSDYCSHSADDPLDLIQNPFEYDPLITNYTNAIMKNRDLILKDLVLRNLRNYTEAVKME